MMSQPVCPVCNGAKRLYSNCTRCFHPASDEGPIENFLGPYSAYEQQLIFEGQETEIIGPGYCWHLVDCNVCGYLERVKVKCITL